MPAKIEQEVINKLITFYKNNNCTYKEASQYAGVHRKTGAMYLRNTGYGRSKNNRFRCRDQVFNKIDTEEKAYWLGFLYADGNVASKKNNMSLGLALKDKDHVQKLSDFVMKEYKPVRTDHFRARFQVGSKPIKEALIDKGCVPRKSDILKFPDKNQVPLDLLRHFIRGYFDGDGCISLVENINKYRENRWELIFGVLGTKEFLRDLNLHFGFDSVYTKLANKGSKANCYQCTYTKAQMEYIVQYVYGDCNIYLERKYKKVVKYCRKNKKLFLLQGSKYGEGCDADTVVTTRSKELVEP